MRPALHRRFKYKLNKITSEASYLMYLFMGRNCHLIVSLMVHLHIYFFITSITIYSLNDNPITKVLD